MGFMCQIHYELIMVRILSAEIFSAYDGKYLIMHNIKLNIAQYTTILKKVFAKVAKNNYNYKKNNYKY